MIGVLVNVAAVIVGSIVGLFLKKGMPENLSKSIMNGVGVCVVCIGVLGIFDKAADGNKVLIMILAVVLGVIIGEVLKIDARLNKLANSVEKKLSKGDKNVKFAEGFVSATLLFCVGAMAIVGSIDAGIRHNYDTLFAKSILDGIASIVMASTLGVGVSFSVIPLFILQGGIALLAKFVEPYLTSAMIGNMSVVGSVLIIMIGLNMLKITSIKVANFLPAILIALGLTPLFAMI